jgi:hypothetical protein
MKKIVRVSAAAITYYGEEVVPKELAAQILKEIKVTPMARTGDDRKFLVEFPEN